MKKLFLDANILFSAAYRENAGVLTLWQLPEILLYSSLYAVEETDRNLDLPEQQWRLNQLLTQIEIISPTYAEVFIPRELTLRDKDKPILQAAIAAKVDYLITGDIRDFGPYFGQKIQGVIILPPAKFLKRHLP